MNLSLKNKTSFFILFLIATLLAPLNGSSAKEKMTDWLDEPITLSFQNEPLSNVLKQITKQTGISIGYDQNLAKERVSGNYQGVKASDAITRLFRSKNKTIQVNKEKKVIIVKTFGAKRFIWTGTGQEQNNSPQLTYAELKKLHSQQYKEYKERITNDNEVLKDGTTRGELKSIHLKQYKEYQARINNDNERLEGGMTRGEIKKMHLKQYKEYQAGINNDNDILEGGITRGKTKTMHLKQYKEYQARINNNNDILEGGMTRDEIEKMHLQQYKEHQTRVNNDNDILKGGGHDTK